MKGYLKIKHVTITNNEWVDIKTSGFSVKGVKNLDSKPYATEYGVTREVNDMSVENLTISVSAFVERRSGEFSIPILYAIYKNRYDPANPLFIKGVDNQGIKLLDIDGEEDVEVVLKSFNLVYEAKNRKISDDEKSGLNMTLSFIMTKELEESE